MSATATAPRGHAYVHGGREVYTWEQSLEDVTVHVRLPLGVPASAVDCRITASAGGHVRLGLRGAAAPYLDAHTGGPVIADESTWFIDDAEAVPIGAPSGTSENGRILQLVLVKALQGEAWPAAFAGHAALDPAAHELDRKAILLERFGAEHPGFDFRDADITGAVPDARSFMGGMRKA